MRERLRFMWDVVFAIFCIPPTTSFSPTHYRCKLCGVYSGSPDALCFPEEKTFEE